MDIARINELETALLRITNYLKKFPISPATSSEINAALNVLISPCKDFPKLTDVLVSPAGVPLLTISLMGKNVMLSVPIVEEAPAKILNDRKNVLWERLVKGIAVEF